MGAYVGVDVLCECEVFFVWPLTRKRSLGMNARQAQGWERIGRTDARMKKIFARMQSNGNMADENFWRDTVEPIHVLRKFLNGCSRTDTRLTKIFERIRTKGWTAEEKLWTDGCVMCRVFLEQIHGVNEVRIQCIFFCDHGSHSLAREWKWWMKITELFSIH